LISVLLVDDQDLVRMGLRALFDSEQGFEVVGEAADGFSALEQVRETQPDVVLMDIRMPGIDGLEATRRIAADSDLQHVKILVLTTFEHDEFVFEALRGGASGFLLKSTPPDTLLEAVRTIADGGALLDPAVTRSLVQEFVELAPRAPVAHPSLDRLTKREREIVSLVAQGLANHDIAAHLVLSPATVRTHVSRAMTKLGARDRAQLVVFAYQSGLAT